MITTVMTVVGTRGTVMATLRRGATGMAGATDGVGIVTGAGTTDLVAK